MKKEIKSQQRASNHLHLQPQNWAGQRGTLCQGYLQHLFLHLHLQLLQSQNCRQSLTQSRMQVWGGLQTNQESQWQQVQYHKTTLLQPHLVLPGGTQIHLLQGQGLQGQKLRKYPLTCAQRQPGPLTLIQNPFSGQSISTFNVILHHPHQWYNPLPLVAGALEAAACSRSTVVSVPQASLVDDFQKEAVLSPFCIEFLAAAQFSLPAIC